MGWGRPKRGGWGPSGGTLTGEAEAVNRFSQIIRTVISVMPGGVIRYGKDGPEDDGHVGFWLGVTVDGVARFSVGGPAFWLKWDGAQLLVRGKISTLSGDNPDDRVRWVGSETAGKTGRMWRTCRRRTGGATSWRWACRGRTRRATRACWTCSWTATLRRACGCGCRRSGAPGRPVRKYWYWWGTRKSSPSTARATSMPRADHERRVGRGMHMD